MKRGLITDYVLQSFDDDIWKPDLDACMKGEAEGDSEPDEP